MTLAVNQLIGFGVSAGDAPATPADCLHRSTQIDISSGTTYSGFSSITVDSGDTQLLVIIWGASNTTVTVTATRNNSGGVTMTQIDDSSTTSIKFYVLHCALSGDTSVSLSATFGASQSRCGFGAWTTENVDYSALFNESSIDASSPIGGNVDVPADGIGVGLSWAFTTSDYSADATWTTWGEDSAISDGTLRYHVSAGSYVGVQISSPSMVFESIPGTPTYRGYFVTFSPA